jgi:hypothetical protein
VKYLYKRQGRGEPLKEIAEAVAGQRIESIKKKT